MIKSFIYVVQQGTYDGGEVEGIYFLLKDARSRALELVADTNYYLREDWKRQCEVEIEHGFIPDLREMAEIDVNFWSDEIDFITIEKHEIL